MMYPESDEVMLIVRRALRKAKNNGDVAIEAVSKILIEDADIRAEIATMLVNEVRGDVNFERRRRYEEKCSTSELRAS